MDAAYCPFQEYHTVEDMDIDLRRPSNLQYSRYMAYPSNDIIGFRIDLFAKYFKLKNTFSKMYHYYVNIKLSFSHKDCKNLQVEGQYVRNPERFSVYEEKCKQVIAELLKLNKSEKFIYIYDGKNNLLTSVELPILRKCTFTIKLTTDEKYDIDIEPLKRYSGTNVITLSLLQSMTLFSGDEARNDLLKLNEALELRYNTEINFDTRSMFHTDKFDIGKGLEVWRGYEQNINLSQAGPAYVLNVSELVFHKDGPVINYVNELLELDITKINRPLTPDERKEIKNSLCGVTIYVTHLPYRRTYTIEDVSDSPVTDVPLYTIDKVQTVAEYHEEKYHRLLFPYLPCFKMRCNTNTFPVYIPLENCMISEGQLKRDYYKTDSEEKSNTEGNFASFVHNKENDSRKSLSLLMDLTQEFFQHLSIGPPLSKCLGGSEIYDTLGWGRRGDLLKLSKDGSWIVLSFVDETQLPLSKIAEFVDCLRAISLTVGLWLGRFLGIHIIGQVTLDKVFLVEEVKNAALGIILLPESSNNCEEIKFIADYRLGLVTKYVRSGTVKTFTQISVTNTCLRIITKLGRASFDLSRAPKIFSQPVVVFGAVIKKLKGISFASAVGSLDAYPSRYQVSCRVQEEKKKGKIIKEFILEIQ